MLTHPDTIGIASVIKALAETTIFARPLAQGAATTYKSVTIGALRDYNERTPLLEIEGRDDQSKRAAVGGKIQERLHFLLRSVVPYTTATDTAEEDIFLVRDAITILFQSSARLKETPGVTNSQIIEENGRFIYTLRNGVWWRAHEFVLAVTHHYTVTITP